MTISQIMEKMIAFSNGNIHDIDHLIRVWTYAKTIGELEGLDQQTQYVLKSPQLRMILPAHCAVRNMAIQMANTRKQKVL